MKEWIGVALGGMLGSVARHAITLGVQQCFGKGFPYGTLLVNAVGGLLIGIGWSLAEKNGWMQGAGELAWRVGFLGGLTTFSSYSLEVVRLYQEGHSGAAVAAMLVNVFLSIGFVVLGMNLGRLLSV